MNQSATYLDITIIANIDMPCLQHFCYNHHWEKMTRLQYTFDITITEGIDLYAAYLDVTITENLNQYAIYFDINITENMLKSPTLFDITNTEKIYQSATYLGITIIENMNS